MLRSKVGTGRFVAVGIIEIQRFPSAEILSNMPQMAAMVIDDGFSRMLTDYALRAKDGTLALELLMLGLPVENQLYRAQPHCYIVVRKLADRIESAEAALLEVLGDLLGTLSRFGYQCRTVDDDAMTAFIESLETIDASKVVSLTREELAFAVMGVQNVYYVDPLPPDPVRNLTLLTNALCDHPRCAFSLTLIPTTFTSAELDGIEKRRMYVDVLRRQVMMTPGAATPTAYIESSKAYQDLTARANEPMFYFLLTVYASPSSAKTLANRLVSLFASPEFPDVHMIKTQDVTAEAGSITNDFLIKPWTLSDVLIFRLRNQTFWTQPQAPHDLIRLKQLAPFSSVKFAFRLPFDDGDAIGLETNRNNSAREKLHQAVLSSDSLRIGTIIDTGYTGGAGEAPQAGIPYNDLTKHGMIVGKSGSGKTNFIHTMLIRLTREGVPFLAIEPTKTEYRCLKDAIDDLVVFTPGINGVSPFIINPFIPPPGVTVESYIPSLMSAFETAFTMPDPLPAIFREVINKTYNKYGWRMDSTCEDTNVRWFGFHEMIRVFQDHVASMDYEGEVRSNISTAGVLRLSSLIEQNANIYDTTPTIPVHELLRQPVVLELNAITAKEQKTLLMGLLLVAICTYTKFNTPPDGQLKNVVLIDEAHVLFGDASESVGGGNRAAAELEAMIAEIRAYGTGVFVADQTPATFGASIIANTDTKIMFRVVEKGGKDTLEAACDLTPTKKELLSKLGVGECLLYYGKLPEPILVKADDARSVAEFRHAVSNEEIRHTDSFWSTHRDLLMPFPQCSACAVCSEHGCDLELRSTTEFIASRMVNFYLPYIQSKELLEAFVKTKGASIAASQLKANGISDDLDRAVFCVMTRFLRRLLRTKRFDVSERDLNRYVSVYGALTLDKTVSVATDETSSERTREA